MNRLERLAFRTARAAARRRGSRPALHPDGVIMVGRLDVPARATHWDVPWLGAPGSYAVTARWSRAAGLPRLLPDGAGLALRVADAGGPGRPLDLLLTTSGRGRWSRHVPLPRTSATAGPYSTLLPYVVGGRRGVLALFPEPRTGRVPARPAAVGAATAVRPLAFRLCIGERAAWRPLARLILLGADAAARSEDGEAFDPYRNLLPDVRPVDRLRSLRVAAYAGSRAGRHAGPPG
ncbi:phosphodiesterase [Streptomyces sp. AM 2-1-1]|uniref:phosphodiesterase n=1 Tax=Streptomyces sp. AM 2-1-1 TaxID=3028709 RepID=UPI0023B8A993|nr:phosphodiesterase [Streptomyces sp. AM 2-1-1]WEH39209.1 phosphodiesterase [Streptomyces sp. AM 2-1-1]